MPVVLDTQGAPPHLVLRRLDRDDLRGLAELLPSALGGDVEPWTDGTACP
jgi:hypothetical protein